MTVGEKIRNFRKELGMSQEELGQKLLVSRQTISLWEKGQTVPTVDKLTQLKEIFGVSVDEMLGLENKEENTLKQPMESYCFHYTRGEMDELHQLQKKSAYKRPVLCALIYVFIVISMIRTSVPDVLVGIAFGMFLFGLVFDIKRISAYGKVWKNSIERICKSTYEYNIYEHYISISIYRDNEIVGDSKCYYKDIEQIRLFGNWLLFQFSGQLYIVRKSDLKENSVFYSYMYKNPSKTIESTVPNKWRTASVILFVASLLSILGAITLVGAVSNINGLFVENMWMFFLFTPVPIASVIFGVVLKIKGLKYKKNVVAGLIMLFLLCVYGSFVFMF